MKYKKVLGASCSKCIKKGCIYEAKNRYRLQCIDYSKTPDSGLRYYYWIKASPILSTNTKIL